MPPVTLLTTPGARNVNHEVLNKIPGLLFVGRADFLLGDSMGCAMLLGQSITNNLSLPKHPNAAKYYINKISKRIYGLILEANHHLTELQEGTKSLRRIMNEHRQHEFWTLVFYRLRKNRGWEAFTPYGPQVEALLDRFCTARQDYLTAQASSDAKKEEINGPVFINLFYGIPDDCDLIFAPSPQGRAASPIDETIDTIGMVASAATTDTDESPDTIEEHEEQEEDAPVDSFFATMQLWAIVRPVINREQSRLGLRTYQGNELAKYLRDNTQ